MMRKDARRGVSEKLDLFHWKGNVLGTAPHVDGRYGRKTPCGKQAPTLFVQRVIRSGVGLKEPRGPVWECSPVVPAHRT